MAFEDAVIDPSIIEHIDRIEEMYNAPFVRFLGMELVSLSREEARLRMELHPEHLNSHGIGHGGVVYAIADHAFAFASNIDCDATGQCASITYHRPASGRFIEAVAKRINDSKSFGNYEVFVYSDNGKLVASGMFTAFKIKRG